MRPITDPLLSHVAGEVRPAIITTPEIQAHIARMYEVARGQRRAGLSRRRKSRRTLVGLAAPQIGVPLRIILIDTKVHEDRKRYSKLQCFINPVIVWRAHEAAEGREGCFSTGNVWGLVRRAVAVKVQAYDESGTQVEHIFEGFTARIAQHEIDHLNGIRFPERITNDKKRHWVTTEQLIDYPDHINAWPATVTLEQWLEVSGG